MTELLRQQFEHWRMEEFLDKYRDLRLRPTLGNQVVLSGILPFSAKGPQGELIEDTYEIEILIPPKFPKQVPTVRETAGRIPGNFHKLNDGSLCLGSATRLRLALTDSPSIASFVERVVIPYLYGYSYFKKHGSMPFGELRHGGEGILQDLASLYGVKEPNAISQFVHLTSMKKRDANKRLCPCGSQRRLGECHHRLLNELRARLGRNWFR